MIRCRLISNLAYIVFSNAVQEFPLKSKLDPQVYGPPESAITVEMIEEEIGGLMTVEEVILAF